MYFLIFLLENILSEQNTVIFTLKAIHMVPNGYKKNNTVTQIPIKIQGEWYNVLVHISGCLD